MAQPLQPTCCQIGAHHTFVVVVKSDAAEGCWVECRSREQLHLIFAGSVRQHAIDPGYGSFSFELGIFIRYRDGHLPSKHQGCVDPFQDVFSTLGIEAIPATAFRVSFLKSFTQPHFGHHSEATEATVAAPVASDRGSASP
ncbi:hypothetical protein [Paraburkholderia silvatlantica]|uniref:hypothetical protein n=1 Tax=Paraburkholderia silvatlantica TaxID=321895 RepID=UPI0037528F9A